MRVTCACPRSSLCEACRDQLLFHHRGIAAARGHWWARDVAGRMPVTSPWPPFEGRCAEIARRKVADLSSDPLVAEQLAKWLVEEAARTWHGLARQRLE
jgi:hypothetical protein